jgi:hypothetical protein
LREAGAVILGKTNTHEFANGPTGDRSASGPTRNPHAPIALREVRAPGRPPRSPRAPSRSPSAPTPAGRHASPPPAAASSASDPLRAPSPPPASSRWLPLWTPWAPWPGPLPTAL